MTSFKLPFTPPIEGPLPWITLQVLGIIHHLDKSSGADEDPLPPTNLEAVLRTLKGYGEEMAKSQQCARAMGFTTEEAHQIAQTHVTRVTGLQPHLVTPERLRVELGDLTAAVTSLPQALTHVYALTELLSLLVQEPLDVEADLRRVRGLSVAQQLIYRTYRVALVARSEQPLFYRDVVTAAHADVYLPYQLEALAEESWGAVEPRPGNLNPWMRRLTSQREREQLMTVVEEMCRLSQPSTRQQGALASAAAQLVRRWRQEEDVDAIVASVNLRYLLASQ